MQSTNTPDSLVIQDWMQQNLSVAEVENILQAQGFCDVSNHTLVQTFKKKKYEKRQTHGFILLGIGAFLGFVSCVCTVANAFPTLYNFILYGITSIAVMIIFWGLYLALEN